MNALLHTWKGRPGEALGTCLGPHRDKEFCWGQARILRGIVSCLSQEACKQRWRERSEIAVGS